jgi:hypothetical protein
MTQSQFCSSHFWSHVSTRTQAWMAVQIIAVITGGLYLDIKLGWLGQHLATFWALAVWSWLFWLGGRTERALLILATVISGMGEIFLSLVWGLYDYQFSNVPLFVPPGHALLMTLGILVARHIDVRFVWLTIALGAKWAIYVWWTDMDRFGVVLFGMFCICAAFGRARVLYACMFVVALIMELYGTWLGNWFWHSQAPWLQLSSTNPPFSAGAFYCVLDLIVLSLIPLVSRFLPAPSIQLAAQPATQTSDAVSNNHASRQIDATIGK